MILHTGIALGVTLVVLAAVLALLQYREKVCFINVEENLFKSFRLF